MFKQDTNLVAEVQTLLPLSLLEWLPALVLVAPCLVALDQGGLTPVVAEWKRPIPWEGGLISPNLSRFQTLCRLPRI